MSRRQPAKASKAATAPIGPKIHLPGLAILLIGLLLPLCAAGVPLDEVATPGPYAGRLLLAMLAVFVLWKQPATRAERRWAMQPPVWLVIVGIWSLLIPRGGPVVPAIDVPGVGAAGSLLHLRLPADFEAGLVELLRLGLLLAIALAAVRVPMRYTLLGLCGGAAVILMRGLQEYLPELRGGDPSWRVFGGFTNPNLLAGYLVVVLPPLAAAVALADDDSVAGRWLVAQGVDKPALKMRLLGGVVLAGGVLLLGLTRSRGGLLACGCGVLAACVGLYRAGWRRGAAWLLFGAMLAGVLVALGPLRPRLLAMASQAHSAGFRELTWAGTWDLARQVPLLGVGLGGWMTSYPVFAQASFTQHAHQGYLQVLAEGGVLALAAKLAWLIGLLLLGWRACRDARPEAKALGPALLGSTVGFMVHDAFDFDWYVPAILFALAIQAAATLRLLAGAEVVPTRRKGLVFWLLLVAGLGIVTVAERQRLTAQTELRQGHLGSAKAAADAGLGWAPWSAGLDEERAGIRTAMGQLDAARAAYRKAIERRPNAARLWYRLAALEAEAGDLPAAVADSAVAVRLSPMHLQGWLQLGKLLEQQGEANAARGGLRELDRRATLPALAQQDPLKEYTFEPTHGYGLMRLAELALAAGDTAEARDAFDRARPDLRAYLETYDREEQVMAPLDPETRTAMMRLRGLDADERDEVAALLRRAEEMVGEL